MHNFDHGKSAAVSFSNKLPKEIIRPIGEKSPNLVTLVPSAPLKRRFHQLKVSIF
jgi:hypothetical protein